MSEKEAKVCVDYPVAIPKSFEGSGSIHQDAYTLNASKMHYTGSDNAKFVTTPILTGSRNLPSQFSNNLENRFSDKGDEEHLHHFVVQSEVKNEGRGVDVVEKGKLNLVQVPECGGQLQQQLGLSSNVAEVSRVSSSRQNLSKQSDISENGETISNHCNARCSAICREKLHLYINRFVNECASDVDDSVRKKIIDGLLEFIRSNSDWLKQNFSKDSGVKNSKSLSQDNFPFKDKEGLSERDMITTSMQYMSGCNDYNLANIMKDPSKYKDDPGAEEKE